MLLSNCAFDRGSLFPTYNKPFELFARGTETGDWLLRLDSYFARRGNAERRNELETAWGAILPTAGWLAALDDFRNWLIREAA